MKDVAYWQVAEQIAEQLPKGAFLSVAHGGKRNTMTIGWGGLSFFWKKPAFIAPVRLSRYTHELLAPSMSFTVSIPNGDLVQQLKAAGTLSGRDVDKFEGHGITPAPARLVEAPIIAQCSLHLECKVLATQVLDPGQMDPWVISTAYPKGDVHTLFFGEVLAAYQL